MEMRIAQPLNASAQQRDENPASCSVHGSQIQVELEFDRASRQMKEIEIGAEEASIEISQEVGVYLSAESEQNDALGWNGLRRRRFGNCTCSSFEEENNNWEAMADCIQQVMIQAGDQLDKQRECMKEALGKASVASLFFSSRPLQASLSGRLIQLWLLITGIIVSEIIFTRMIHLGRNGSASFRDYRFRGPLETGDSLGPMWDGREISLRFAQTWQSEAEGKWERFVSFPEAVTINGWWRATNHSGSESLSELHRFHLCGSLDGQNWTPLLGSDAHDLYPWRLTQYIGKDHVDYRMVWDFRATNEWIGAKVIQQVLIALGFFTTLILALMGKLKGAVISLSSLNLTMASASFWRAAYTAPPDEAIFRYLNGFIFTFTAGLNVFAEQYFFLGWLLIGGVDLAEGLHDYNKDGYLSNENWVAHFVPSSLTLLFFWGVMMFRVITKARARHLIRPDKSIYDHCWEELISVPENVVLFQRLAQLCSSCPPASNQVHQLVDGASCPPQVIGFTSSFTSLYATTTSSSSRGGERNWWQDGILLKYSTLFDADRHASGIQSLDQLYHQARFVHHMLLHKVKELALACGGWFPCHPLENGERFLPWQDASKDPALASKVIWPGVKRVNRAIEKAVRKYRNDVSRLVDVCRAVIVFNDISNLCDCVHALKDDPTVEIVRVKNRFSQDYDCWQTLGYRDVAFNFRLRNDASIGFKTDMHIVELQLNLRQFAERKNDEGHRRYIAYRDLVAS